MRTLVRSLPTAAALSCAALLVAALSWPTTTAAYSVLGESLDLGQRDFRVFNNFLDAAANDNVVPHPNFPGHTGAVMAIWKAHSEWGSSPRAGDGLGDGVASNPNLGDGGANFDNAFQGLAASSGGMNGNVHSSSSSIGGAVIAFTQTPISDGWSIIYNEDFILDDGPGLVDSGIDLQGIATHEIGHALGLGHSSVGGATMFPSISGTGTNQRSLGADDIAGIQAVYGTASASKPRIDATSGPVVTGGALVLDGVNFDAAGNEVWFTAQTGDGTPVKLTGVPATGGGTQISVSVPAGVESGDVLVKVSGSGGAALSNAFPLRVDGPPGAYVLTGPGLAGSGQNPQLTGDGDLTAGGAGFDLHTNLVKPFATGTLFVALNEANLPFKGGVFDPAPILLQVPVVMPADGLLTLPTSMPPAIPSGTGFVLQGWFSDATAVQGVSATNGLRLDVP
ncbi:MAG: matrixin family metalloprotease [Planctomycetota bacterium]|jgi:hypothetical protein